MKIIKFYSDTCGPCKVLDSNLKKANIDYESINANSDENYTLVEKYKIRAVPTLIKEDNGGPFTEGNIVLRYVPYKKYTRSDFRRKINLYNVLYYNKLKMRRY